ncbi:hypothetical protein FH608_049090 [Nonomuraea phyllanthi]|uniref:Uncharacterized protein n=1 Tax=Nonomuraea phyllanthi TaxID=2219224 RepID=A0A5C4UYJ0_9ACTN|nr:hypothetical protein [Nonomuraea phyllanthi]KAB8183295.1 hypothetical protein FH608_049090 [Nonomuraea phyllanthi]QFY12608.1 hypothetical protein GBF35_43920 [Nonomuraea phyllanthi]
MTRSEFDDIRAFLADEGTHAGDLLRMAGNLIDDLEHARMREAVLRTHYLRLLTAARATAAADTVGAPDPLAFLRHELAEHGQLPEDGEAVQRILADAQTAATLLAHLEAVSPPDGGSSLEADCALEDDAPKRPRSVRLRRCVGTRRTLPR